MCTDASLSQVNGLTARAARARVVAEMTTNWERHYVHFVDVDVRDVYLAQMSEHGTYGDHCTLVAFASAFNVRIRVWGADDTHDTVVPSVASEAMENSDRPIINIGHRHDADRMRRNGVWLCVHSDNEVLRIAAVRAFLRVHAQNMDRGGRGRMPQRVRRSFSDRINHGAWTE